MNHLSESLSNVYSGKNVQNLNKAGSFQATLEFVEFVFFLFGRLSCAHIRADLSIILRPSEIVAP